MVVEDVAWVFLLKLRLGENEEIIWFSIPVVGREMANFIPLLLAMFA